jgi:hypothetical protein
LNEGERAIVGHLAEYRVGQKVSPKDLEEDGGGKIDSAGAGAAGER